MMRAWTLGIALAATTTLPLLGCFTGNFLAGQPCMNDSDCGPNLRCEEGRCGGATASAGEVSTSATTMTTMSPTTSSAGTSSPVTSSASEATGGSGGTTSTTGVVTTATTSAAMTSSSTTGDATTGAGCGIGRCEMIDVLLILDDSPSMASKQTALYAMLQGIADFIFPLLEEACSVHIGLITTDEYAKNPEECRVLGALTRGPDGQPCPFVEGNVYATKPDLADPPSFNCAIAVGAEGDPNERPYDALYRSLVASLNDNCNQGFHRDGALLIVILATDEDDGDKDDPQGHPGSTLVPTDQWLGALELLKAGGLDNLYIAAVLGDENPMATECPWMPLDGVDGSGASPAPVLRSFLAQFPAEQRVVGSICKPMAVPGDYVPMWDELVGEVRDFCGAP